MALTGLPKNAVAGRDAVLWPVGRAAVMGWSAKTQLRVDGEKPAPAVCRDAPSSAVQVPGRRK